MPTKTEYGTLGGAYNTWPAAIAIYALVAFLTFGHVFNMNYVEPTPVVECGVSGDPGDPTWAPYWDCRTGNIYARTGTRTMFEASFPATFASAAWPIYWAGHYAIKVTK